MQIDTNSLANLLRNVRAATIVGLSARTVPAMRKTDNPYFGRVVKLTRLTAVIGANYASAVNRRRVKEAALSGRSEVQHFEESPRTWGRHARSTSRTTDGRRRLSPLILYRGKRYLQLQRQTVLQVEYRYAATGRPLAAEKIDPFLKANNPGRRQQLRKPVICREYTLENILQFRMKGKIYEIIPAQRRSAA